MNSHAIKPSEKGSTFYRRRLLILIVALAALAAACSGNSPAPAGQPEAGGGETRNDEAAAGAELYASTCAVCHGENAEGRPHVGPNLVANTFVQERSDDELLAFINEGRAVNHPDNTTGIPMPPKGGNPALSDAQVLEIIGYIRGLAS